MKNKLLSILLILFGIMALQPAYGQCVPADSIACPDPENNGQICPDSLPPAYQAHNYHQSFTILAPQEVTFLGTTFPLHHLKLKDIGNLPEGIDWVSNTDDSVFMAGNYYCVLLSGTPSDTGTYPLRIVVDVFINYNGGPLFISEVTDSTSLSLQVEPYNGIGDSFLHPQDLTFVPNPFTKDVRLQFTTESGGKTEITFYTLQGTEVLKQERMTVPGKNILFTDGTPLAPGHYLVSVVSGNKRFTGIVTKTR